ANSGATGVTASYNSAAGNVTLTAVDGRDIIVSQGEDAGFTAAHDEGLRGMAADVNNAENSSLDITADATATVVARGTIRLTAADQIVIGGGASEKIGY